MSRPGHHRGAAARTVAPALALALGAAAGAGCARNPSALDPKGPQAGEAAWLFWLMLALSSAVLVLVAGLLLGSARRRGPTAGSEAEPGPDDRSHGGRGDPDGRRSIRWILIGGIALPVVVVVPLSVVTLLSLNRTEQPADDDALVVELEGRQFWWEVRYPGTAAVTANEIHIPVDRDVRFVLTTADVIHSFWVPNLGGKRDMIPGETTELVYRADEAGVYEGFCAEFCGIQHAWMRLRVIAQPADEFERWLEGEASDAVEPMTELQQDGLDAFLAVGCASCHQIRGTDAAGRVGPDLTHFAGRTSLGAVVSPNTRGALGGWISNPHGLKPGTTMPPTPLTGDQLRALIEYLESLR